MRFITVLLSAMVLAGCVSSNQNAPEASIENQIAGEWWCTSAAGAITGTRSYSLDNRFESVDNAALPDPDGGILDVVLLVDGDWKVEDDLFIDSVTHIEILDTFTHPRVINNPLVQLFATSLQNEFAKNPSSRSKISELTEDKLALIGLETGGTTVCERPKA